MFSLLDHAISRTDLVVFRLFLEQMCAVKMRSVETVKRIHSLLVGCGGNSAFQSGSQIFGTSVNTPVLYCIFPPFNEKTCTGTNSSMPNVWVTQQSCNWVVAARSKATKNAISVDIETVITVNLAMHLVSALWRDTFAWEILRVHQYVCDLCRSLPFSK